VEHKGFFDENWEIFQGSWELDENEKQEIEEIYKHHEKNFCRRCDYCQPCTEEIPIQLVLGMRSIVKRMGENLLVKGRLRDAIEKARNCSECEECITRCPYDLPIPELIKERVKWSEEKLASLEDR